MGAARDQLCQRLRQIAETRPVIADTDLEPKYLRHPHFVSDEGLVEMIGKASALYQFYRAARANALSIVILTEWDYDNGQRVRYTRVDYHRARASLRALCAEAARRAKAHRAADRMLSRAVKMAGQGGA